MMMQVRKRRLCRPETFKATRPSFLLLLFPAKSLPAEQSFASVDVEVGAVGCSPQLACVTQEEKLNPAYRPRPGWWRRCSIPCARLNSRSNSFMCSFSGLFWRSAFWRSTL